MLLRNSSNSTMPIALISAYRKSNKLSTSCSELMSGKSGKQNKSDNFLFLVSLLGIPDV